VRPFRFACCAQSLGRARSYLQNITLPDGTKGASFAVAGSDPTDAVYERYRALGMPASFFIDRTGRIADIANGPIVLEQFEQEPSCPDPGDSFAGIVYGDTNCDGLFDANDALELLLLLRGLTPMAPGCD
jgi:hypothetical protein